MAEQMFSDMVDAIKEKQEELEKAIAEYKSSTPIKLNMDVTEDDENIKVAQYLTAFPEKQWFVEKLNKSIAIAQQNINNK